MHVDAVEISVCPRFRALALVERLMILNFPVPWLLVATCSNTVLRLPFGPPKHLANLGTSAVTQALRLLIAGAKVVLDCWFVKLL